MKSFWFHYNKPASKSRGKPTITVHWDGVCYLVDNLFVHVPTQGRIRKTQPYFVMAGKAEDVKIVFDVAYILGKGPTRVQF